MVGKVLTVGVGSIAQMVEGFTGFLADSKSIGFVGQRVAVAESFQVSEKGAVCFAVIAAHFTNYLGKPMEFSHLLLGRVKEYWLCHQTHTLIHLLHHNFHQINLPRGFSFSYSTPFLNLTFQLFYLLYWM